MSKRTKAPWRRQLVAIAASLTILLGSALPVVAPFLTDSASAADPVPAFDLLYGGDAGTNNRIDLSPTQQWAHKTTCYPKYETRILNSALIQQSTGIPNFDQYLGRPANEVARDIPWNFSDKLNSDNFPYPGSIGYHFVGFGNGTAATGAERTAAVQFWFNHMGKKVNAIGFYNSESAAGNLPSDSCGGEGNPHFLLIPVAANGDIPTRLIGKQVYFAPVPDNQYDNYDYSGPGANIEYVPNGTTDGGRNTQGTMKFYTPSDHYATNNPTTVAGIALNFTGTTVGYTDLATASFLDAAHIQADYVNGSGRHFAETYTDFVWDDKEYYFLTKSADPSRNDTQTIAATGEDPGIDPHATPSASKVPFIAVCGTPKINFGNKSAAGLVDMQKGINQLGSVLCDGLNVLQASFYDYAPDGSLVGDAPQGGLSNSTGVKLTGQENARIWFYGNNTGVGGGTTNDSDAIVSVFERAAGNETPYNGTYSRNHAAAATSVLYDHAGTDCPYLGRVTLGTAYNPVATGGGVFNATWGFAVDGSVCQSSYGSVQVLVKVDPDAFNDISDQPAPADSGNTAPPKVVCDVELNPLTWLICPFATGAISLAGTFDTAINSMLNISVNDYLNEQGTCNSASTNPGPCFYAAWSSFRVLAMAVIVIAGLAMIISQALGADLLDAYTVKKVLPRLLIAVILIAVSWQLLKAAISLSDIIGYGVRGLIYKPFSALGASHIAAGTSSALAVLGGGAFLGLGVLGLLSFALTALLAVFIGFSLLVFREMVVIFMVIIAPLAIALSILPNTRKGYKLWIDTTMGALLMFPIIAGFIAIGHVFAQVAYQVNGSGIISQFIFIIAYFAPYFLIPLAFRLAGGLVATVGGIVNDRSKGAFDRLKNYRSNKIKGNMEKMRTGERFSNNTAAGRAFNNTTEGLSTFANSESKWGFLTNQGVRDAAFQEQRQMNSGKHAQSARGQAAKENDPLLHMQSFASEDEARRGAYERFGSTYDTRTAQGRQNLEAAVSAARANGGWSRQRQDYAARRLAATGTGYANIDQMQRTVAAVAGNNRAMASSLLGEINAVTKGVGRHDLAAGYGEQMSMYDSIQRRGGRGGLTAAESQRAYIEAIKGTDIVTLLRDKKQSIENTMPALQSELVVQQQRAAASSLPAADRQRAKEEAGRLTGIIESVSQNSTYAAPINIQRSNELVIEPTAGQQVGGPPVGPIGNRQEVVQSASPILLKRNPTTGVMEPVYARGKPKKVPVYYPGTNTQVVKNGIPQFKRVREFLTDPETGQRIPLANPTYDPAQAAAYKAQRPNGTLSPNDPRYGA